MIVEERVDRLENLMAHSQLLFQGFVVEMREFKKEVRREMKDFKDEMKDFKDEMRDFKNEMKDFKDEMKDFKDEMKDFKDETEKDRKEMNRKWGDIARKIGTITEDMVIPTIEHIVEKYFNLAKGRRFVRTKAYHSKNKSLEKEFDVIMVYDDKIVLNETKSTAKMDYINDFINFIKNREFYEYFPEYKDMEIIPIFASLYIPENIIKHLSKNNIYALGMGKETMDLLNTEIIKKSANI